MSGPDVLPEHVQLVLPCFHCGRPFDRPKARAAHERDGHPGLVIPPEVLADRRRRGHAVQAAKPGSLARGAEYQRRRRRERPDMAIAQDAEYQRRHPDQVKARRSVRTALKSGALQRAECAICEAPTAQAHHHLGYAPEHRLDVVWLCPAHHAEAHHPLAERLGATDLRGIA